MPALQALLDAIATLALPDDPAHAEAQRVFHGRGGLHPGCDHLALDFYPPVWLLTSFEPLADADVATVQAALAARWQALAPACPSTWCCSAATCRKPTPACCVAPCPSPMW
jgi:23S rRNA (cytosine1962-C5)-methyltransferase